MSNAAPNSNTQPTPESEVPLLGADNYDVGPAIASGGMGSILSAGDNKLKRTVAIKVLLQDAHADATLRRRFLREAEVLAMLAHPNIVPIHDIVWEDGLPLFYSMKLVKGRTLQAILNDLRAGDAESLREYPLVRLLSVFRKVCDALAFAHSKGVLHRDLKPENVMVGEFGEVLVMDWGLAKILGEKFPTSLPDLLLEDTSTPQPGRTLHGAVMGTPQYMSPEQAMGLVEELDERSDIHSLGAMLYAVLTLRPPVEGNTPREILELVSGGRITPPSALQSQARAKSKVMGNGRVPAAKLIKPLPHLSGGQVPAALSSVAMHALHLDKAKRYQSVGALAADIESYQNGFATCAEQAGLATQLVLLVKRHRGMFGVLFAAWLLITGLAVWFVINLRAGEQRALVGETIAVREKESTRKALARSSLSLAEAAQRERNGIAMKAALNEVPADLRESTWRYLDDQSDSSIARIRNGTSDITGVAADPLRAGVFAVADRTRKVAVLNVHTGARLLEFTAGFSQTDDASFYRIAFSRDGRHIAVGRDGPGGIVIHNASDGCKEREWPSPASDAVEFGAEGRLLRCGSRNLQVFDSHTGTLLWEQTVPERLSLISALFTPAGNEVVRYTSAELLEIVSAANGSLVRKLGGRRVLYDFRMAVSPDGEMLVACDELRNTQCVSLRDGQPLYTLSGNHLHEKLHFTADGASLVTVSVREDGVQSIDLWNAKTGDPLRSMLGGQGAAAGMSVHPLSDELLVTGPDSRAWDLSGPLPGWRLPAVFTGSVTFWGGDDCLFGIAPGTTDWGLLRLKPGGTDVLWQAEDKDPMRRISARMEIRWPWRARECGRKS
jgi:serine/threonine protein kinase